MHPLHVISVEHLRLRSRMLYEAQRLREEVYYKSMKFLCYNKHGRTIRIQGPFAESLSLSFVRLIARYSNVQHIRTSKQTKRIRMWQFPTRIPHSRLLTFLATLDQLFSLLLIDATLHHHPSTLRVLLQRHCLHQERRYESKSSDRAYRRPHERQAIPVRCLDLRMLLGCLDLRLQCGGRQNPGNMSGVSVRPRRVVVPPRFPYITRDAGRDLVLQYRCGDGDPPDLIKWQQASASNSRHFGYEWT